LSSREKRRDAFTAIADPTRREILDLLLAHEILPAGDIAGHFSTASRPGISRHLRVLRECGLVNVERAGKTQNYTLNPQPLRDIRDGWIANFAAMETRSLAALRKRVEGPRKRTP
jgi:DNA-binding transcriptional ArsR family regulator